VLSLFLGVQKYGKNNCRQIFLVIFFNGKIMVINISRPPACSPLYASRRQQDHVIG